MPDKNSENEKEKESGKSIKDIPLSHNKADLQINPAIHSQFPSLSNSQPRPRKTAQSFPIRTGQQHTNAELANQVAGQNGRLTSPFPRKDEISDQGTGLRIESIDRSELIRGRVHAGR
jgi:hypothetical protein